MASPEKHCLLEEENPQYKSFNTHKRRGSKSTTDLELTSCLSFKQCQFFQELPSAEDTEKCRCYCGQLKELHKKYVTSDLTTWDQSCIQKTAPTNAFGNIEFFKGEVTRGKAGYARVSDEDDVSDISSYMRRNWDFMEDTKPKMCVSVVGYDTEFAPSLGKIRSLCEYLYDMFIQTDTLVLSTGFHSGIGRVVANLCSRVSTYHNGSDDEEIRISTIGVAPWGKVALGDQMELGDMPNTFSYEVSDDQPDNYLRQLSPKFQNFVLIDDGFFGRRISQKFYNASANLEKHIASGNGFGVPTVLIAVGGDNTVLREIYARLLAGIPIIIIGDDQGCVGTLNQFRKIKTEYVSNDESFPQAALDLFEQVTRSLDANLTLDEGNEICKFIFKELDSITFINVDNTEELIEIPKALISRYEECITAVNLAAKLNQPTMAKDLLSSLRSLRNKGRMEALMYDFILMEKSEFVDLLLEFNMHMSSFLTVEALQRLYQVSALNGNLQCCLEYFKIDYEVEKEAEETDALSKFAKKVVRTVTDLTAEEMQSRLKLYHINILLNKLTGKFYSKNYAMTEMADDATLRSKRFQGPFQELFIWALLCGKHELAHFFWKKSQSNIFLAIFGSCICRAMSSIIPESETSAKAQMIETGDFYEDLAINMTNYGSDLYGEFNRSILLTRKETWNSDNISWLAMSGNCRRFLGILPIQDYVYFQWRNNVDAKFIFFLLGLFFPPLIASTHFFPFENCKPSRDSKAALKEEDNRPPEIDPTPSRELTFGEKVKAVYTSHRARYWMRLITYIPILAFLTWTIFFDFVPEYYSTTEIISAVILLSILVDGLYSIIRMGLMCGKYRIRYFFGLTFVWAEIVTAFLTIMCFILRIGFQSEFGLMKVVSAILLMILYWKLFLFFPKSRTLGSSLLSLLRMVYVALKFILIIVVILLPSGIAQQALLFPNLQNLDVEVVSDLFFYDYYRLFGELNLDRSNAKQENCTDNSDDPRCPTSNFFVLVIVAAYMLIAAIFLINFLIALFSNVIEEVDERAYEIWKYNVVVENVIYECRWISPPPLCLIEAIVRAIMCCEQKYRNKNTAFEEVGENTEVDADDGREIRLTEEAESCEQAFQAIQNLANQNFDAVDQELMNESEFECAIRLKESATVQLLASRSTLDAIKAVVKKESAAGENMDDLEIEDNSPAPTVDELEDQLTEFENNVASLVKIISDIIWRHVEESKSANAAEIDGQNQKT